MHGHRPGDTLSPELALVCPELAARARAALPARPWETFAPPQPRLRLVAAAPPAPQPDVVVPVIAAEHSSARWRPRGGTVVLALVAVALVVTGLLPARDAPRLRDDAPAAAPSPGGATFLVEEGDEPDDLVPPTQCLPAGATLGTPLAADGTFALVLPIGDAEIELAGEVENGRVRGSYRVRSPGCDSGSVPFEAPSP